MAKRNYLVEGLSGTGKSSVCEELVRRSYNAVDADEGYAFFADPITGQPTEEHQYMYWVWDAKKMTKLLEDKSQDVLFVCGGANNRDDFMHYFDKVFNLKIDKETLQQRIATRTNNSFGKKEHELARILELHDQDWKPKGAIDIDASKPLWKVVDGIISEIDYETKKQ